MTESEIGGNTPHKIITGSIDYAITINEDGTWQVEYNESVQNKFAANSIMAVLTIGVKENCKNFLRADPKNKAISEQINKSNRALEWLKMNWQSLYTILMNEEQEAEKKMEAPIVGEELNKTDSGTTTITSVTTKQNEPTEE